MSKSTSMLPTLAGGSGVAAHTLVDSDLMKVVDSVTLNADRDRKVTLGELKAFFTSPAIAPTTIPGTATVTWNGTANTTITSTMQVRRTSDGLWTLICAFTTPTPPATWTSDSQATIVFGPTDTGNAVWQNLYDFIGSGAKSAPSPRISDVHTAAYPRSGTGFVGSEILSLENASKQLQFRTKRGSDYSYCDWSNIAPASGDAATLIFEYTPFNYDIA